MKQFILFLLILCSITSLRAEDYLLKGTIGKYPVVVNLYVRGADAEVTYFYTSSCLDIALKGVATNAGLRLYASHTDYKSNKEDTTETLRITENDDKTWKGTWNGKKGDRYDVMLTPLDINSIKNPYANLPVVQEFKNSDGYNYVRSALLPIVKDTAITKEGKYGLRYYHLKNSEIALFEIAQGADKGIAEKANNLLMNKFLENAWNYCSCTAGADTPSYNYRISHVFATDNIMSVVINVEYYCNQAAHPNNDIDPITIDMKTGKELALADVLYLTPTVAPDPKSEKYSDFQSDVFGPKLLAFLKKTYPKEMVAGTDCDYADITSWQFAQWYITSKGVYVAPSFPHAVQGVCSMPDWSYIPFSVLSKYKNPKKHISLP